MNIVYVASDTRSGSTMLDYLLGENPDIVSVGEIRFLHSHVVRAGVGHSYDWKCSCGETLSQCNFWGPLLQKYELEGGDPERDDTSYIQRKTRMLTCVLLLVGLYAPKSIKRRIANFLTQSDSKSVCNVSNALRYMKLIPNTDFVLDSSKKGTQLSCLLNCANSISSTSIKVIHLMRDPRATVCSKVRRKRKGDGLLIYIQSMIGWVLQNAEIAAIRTLVDERDWITLRYEDLCLDTESVIEDLCEQFQIPKHQATVKINKDAKHNICGSPTRFDRTKSRVSLEMSWMENFSFSRKFVYATMAWPFLGVLGFGYRNYYKQ